MTVSADILATWRDTRRVMRAKLAEGPREDRALATLFGACLLIFIAELPGLARAAHLDPSVPLAARIGGALLATLFLLPLVFYALAGISYLGQRLRGWRGSAYPARLALFWSLLATGPLILVAGLISGFAGSGPVARIVGLAVLVVFILIWRAALAEVRARGAGDV